MGRCVRVCVRVCMHTYLITECCCCWGDRIHSRFSYVPSVALPRLILRTLSKLHPQMQLRTLLPTCTSLKVSIDSRPEYAINAGWKSSSFTSLLCE